MILDAYKIDHNLNLSACSPLMFKKQGKDLLFMSRTVLAVTFCLLKSNLRFSFVTMVSFLVNVCIKSSLHCLKYL